MANPRPDRATRVHRQEYRLTTCPVCDLAIVGTLTVEVHLGEVTIEPTTTAGGRLDRPVARVAVETKMRSLRIEHDCSEAKAADAADPHLDTHAPQEQ